MKTSIIRAELLSVLCVLASHAFAKGPCDAVASAQQKQQCVNNEHQKAQIQAKQQDQWKAQQEVQRQAQIKSQQEQQRLQQQAAQQKEQHIPHQQAQQPSQGKTQQVARPPTPLTSQRDPAPLKQSGVQKEPTSLPTVRDSVPTKPQKNPPTAPISDDARPNPSGGKKPKTDVAANKRRANEPSSIRSVKPGNPTYASPSRQNQPPRPASDGGRRPKGERF